jgi:hypothetical protein
MTNRFLSRGDLLLASILAAGCNLRYVTSLYSVWVAVWDAEGGEVVDEDGGSQCLSGVFAVMTCRPVGQPACARAARVKSPEQGNNKKVLDADDT